MRSHPTVRAMPEPSSAELPARIIDLEERIHEIASRRPDSPAGWVDLVQGMEGELSQALEELQVASEELVQQGEELIELRGLLEVERDQFHELFDLAPDGYLVTDANGVIREANRAAGTLLHSEPERLGGKPLAVFVDPEHRKAFRSLLAKLISDPPGYSRHAESRLVPPSGGEPRNVAIAVGAVEGTVRWLIRDVTTERGREHHAAERLRRANEFKDLCLQVIGHDLRGPLASLVGIATTVERRRAALDEEQLDDLLGRLVRVARHMDVLVADLLDLGMSAEGASEHQMRPASLGEVLGRVIGAIERSAHSLVVESEAAVILMDERKVERIVDNLVRNAVIHTAPGSTVWVRGETAPGCWRIVVEDDGPGLPKELREALVGKDGGHGEDFLVEGLGIGLTIVKRFTEGLGGNLTVDERPGGGSRVSVLLPIEIGPAGR